MYKSNISQSGHEAYQAVKFKASISLKSLLGQQKILKIGDKPRSNQEIKLKSPKNTFSERQLTQQYTSKRRELWMEILYLLVKSPNMSIQLSDEAIGKGVGQPRETVNRSKAIFAAREPILIYSPVRTRKNHSEVDIITVDPKSSLYKQMLKLRASIPSPESASRIIVTHLMKYIEFNSKQAYSHIQEIAYEERDCQRKEEEKKGTCSIGYKLPKADQRMPAIFKKTDERTPINPFVATDEEFSYYCQTFQQGRSMLLDKQPSQPPLSHSVGRSASSPSSPPTLQDNALNHVDTMNTTTPRSLGNLMKERTCPTNSIRQSKIAHDNSNSHFGEKYDLLVIQQALSYLLSSDLDLPSRPLLTNLAISLNAPKDGAKTIVSNQTTNLLKS